MKHHPSAFSVALLLLLLVSCGPRFTSEVKATGERPFLALEIDPETTQKTGRVLLLNSESPDLCSLGQGEAALLFTYSGSWQETAARETTDCAQTLAATIEDLASMLGTEQGFDEANFQTKMIYPLVQDPQGRSRADGADGTVYFLGGNGEYLQIVRGTANLETEHLYSVTRHDGRPLIQTERHMDREIG